MYSPLATSLNPGDIKEAAPAVNVFAVLELPAITYVKLVLLGTVTNANVPLGSSPSVKLVTPEIVIASPIERLWSAVVFTVTAVEVSMLEEAMSIGLKKLSFSSAVCPSRNINSLLKKYSKI